MAFNQDVKAIVPDPTKIEPEFLWFFIRGKESEILSHGVKRGATVHSLHARSLENLRIPLPPLPEQRRIVDVLARAEGLVRLHREAVAKAREVVPALFLDMFGDPATNPKGWEVHDLGSLMVDGPQNGLYKHASSYGNGTRILRIDAFYDGKVVALDTLRRLSVDPAELARYALRPNDIVINRVNSPEYLGKSALIPELAEPVVFESNMMRFAIDERRVAPVFLIEHLQTAHTRREIGAKAKHAINQSSINQADVKSFRVPLPPLALQTRFADHVARLRAIQAQAQAALAQAEATFQALLHRAFAGA